MIPVLFFEIYSESTRLLTRGEVQETKMTEEMQKSTYRQDFKDPNPSPKELKESNQASAISKEKSTPLSKMPIQKLSRKWNLRKPRATRRTESHQSGCTEEAQVHCCLQMGHRSQLITRNIWLKAYLLGTQWGILSGKRDLRAPTSRQTLHSRNHTSQISSEGGRWQNQNLN